MSTTTTIFITGASGCIGHYFIERFRHRPDVHLHLLIRNMLNLRPDLAELPNVTIHIGNMNRIEEMADVMAKMDYLLHIATSWKGRHAHMINVEKTHALFRLFNHDRCKRIVYFSTASILGRDNQPITAAGERGIDYVKTKYQSYITLDDLPNRDAIVTLFPTLVFGGDATHPLSHISEGIPSSLRIMRMLLPFIDIDIDFHFIHAADIAAMADRILFMDRTHSDYVIGQAVIRGRDALDTLADVFRIPRIFNFNITRRRINILAKLFRVHIGRWERYLIDHATFDYDITVPEDVGVTSQYPSLRSILDDIKKTMR